MGQAAQREMQARKIEVNRAQLVEILVSNKVKHVAEYEEAKSGYRTVLLAKINDSFDQAERSLARKHKELVAWANDLTDAELAKVDDNLMLVSAIYLEMTVPRSYAKEYDAAIDMAKWDVRETLDLTYAEFTCFVRDQWDWTSDFAVTKSLYAAVGAKR